MEIKVVDGNLTLTSLFAPVAVGYAIGAGVIFLPMFLLMTPLMLMSPGMVDQSEQAVSGAIFVFAPLIMLPLILIMQSVMFGGLIMLGLAIYRKWGAIRVVSVRELPEPRA